MAALHQTWIDRTLSTFAPRWHLQRVRARVAAELVLRHYEGAAIGRRTQGWVRSGADANAANGGAALAMLRDVARDLVRNNPYAESAVATIADHVVGWGIVAKPTPANPKAADVWKAWAETTACDADGRHDFAGLQKLVMSAVVESGEVLVRRRRRLLTDGLPIPLQLQVLEPDFLDTGRTVGSLPNGGQIIQGVEFDAIGRRVAYWLFPQHPGASSYSTSTAALFPASRRIDAADILHVYKARRPGQVRAVTWFAPVIIRLKDFDEYEDATLMKQKIAALLAVITSDVDGSSAPLGTADDTANPGTDTIEPGAIINAPAGRTIEVVQPPAVNEYKDYASVNLHAIATGLHVPYEDLTGNFAEVNFSSARMARLRHWAGVEDWRWRLLIPQFCAPVWGWAMEAAAILGLEHPPAAQWTAPPAPMIEPDKEGLAYQRNIRTGIMSLSEAIRERGYDPEALLAEIAADNKRLDELGLVLDSDARQMTQAGQAQSAATANAANARGLDRFVDFLARLPEGRAVDILQRMFGTHQDGGSR